MPKNSNVYAEHIEHLTTLSRAKGFLGREFLTWLWYLAETKKDWHRLVDSHRQKTYDFQIWVDDRLVLEASSGTLHENVMKGGNPSQSNEAAAALGSGKTVKEVKLGLTVRDLGEFSAVLHCDELNPRSLKLPQPGEIDQQASAETLPLALRIQYTEIFLAALDSLFAAFLKARVAENWEKEDLSEIRSWVKKRQNAGEAGTLH